MGAGLRDRRGARGGRERARHAAIQRVWAFVDVENVPSARVLEKAGLTREGCLRKWYVPSGFGVPRDAWCYAKIKEQP
jgi:ribosomal-protein-alanine N-acetyltransferase